MKSCTEPTAYGVERLEPNFAPAMKLWNASIFHFAPPCELHWRCTSSICVASYTPLIDTLACPTTSASVPRIGPDVLTGEQMRRRFSADAIERDNAWTSFRLRPGQKYGRTRVPSASAVHGIDPRPEVATTGLSQRPSKLKA